MSSVDRMTFLAMGLVARDQMTADMLALWQDEMRREVADRGGVTDDGAYVVTAIARDVLAEVAERGTRIVAERMSTGLRERRGSDEDEIERYEVEVSNALRTVLDYIEAWKP